MNQLFPDQPDASFIDPNSMFGGSSVDVSAIAANPQFAGAPLQNGARNPYPVSSMVPSKRPREDSTGASLSRSQTPAQQGQFGFQGAQHGAPQPLQVASPYSHLQQGGSANATPSPTMQNQHFRPGAVPPQRMQTASPAHNPNAPQMSQMNYMQGSPMGQPGYNQNFGGQFGVPPVQLSQNLQSRQQETQRAYTMRLQQQQHQLGNLAASNMAAQQRHHAGIIGSSAQHPGMQRPMNPAQMSQQQVQARQSLESFLKNVSALMANLGRPFNPQPQAAGRHINLQQLYSAVIKHKGSKYVAQTGSWPRIAQMLGIDPQQFPQAGDELRILFEQNLGPYEAAYIARQQQMMKGMTPQQAQMAGMGAGAQFGQQMSPTKGMPPNAQQQYLQQLQRLPGQQMMEQSTPMKNNAAVVGANGWTTPQSDSKTPNTLQHRKSMSRPLEATPPHGQGAGFASPSPGPDKARGSVPPASQPLTNGAVKPAEASPEPDPTVYMSASRSLNHSWGGFDVDILKDQIDGNLEREEPIPIGLVALKPTMMDPSQMGVIDMRALTMSIRSGLHAEVRLALDMLARISNHHTLTLELAKCDDLVDVMVEYAEDQLKVLEEDNPEVSDILELTPYEDVVRNCRIEYNGVQDVPEVGSQEYELDRTADRLIAITTILRNFTFFETNHPSLTTDCVLRFYSRAIRLVGTRILFLRSHANTADFMKDLITFFSNTSEKITLPSRDEAYPILNFLCAFAPCPRPTIPVKFTPYNPQLHRYLPHAVDSLAKLLAREDNRTYYKHVFAAEATSTPPYDLLTRAFALAISVVPDQPSGSLRNGKLRRRVEARKAFLTQGMLAADILANLAPGADTGLCRSWLEAEDGWASNLLRLSLVLCEIDAGDRGPPQQNGRPRPGQDHDRHGYHLIIHRALSMLNRLGEKSKGADLLVKGTEQVNGHAQEEDEDGDDDEDYEYETVFGGGSKWKVKASVLPRKEMLLGALLQEEIDQLALRQLCSFGGLDA